MFFSQQELTAEQAFWFHILNPTIEPSYTPPVMVDVPSELPKVSLVNASLKKLKFYLTQFDTVVKKRTIPNALEEDVLLTVMNYMSLNNDSVNMKMQKCESCEKCLNLDAEFSKSKQAYNDLLKNYTQLEKHCISLEVSMQLKQEVFQNDESCVNQNAAEISEYFEINDLKARLQDKDTNICKLKDTIKSLSENTKEENVNHDKCELEPINKELENSVAKLLSENEHLCNEINHVKQVFKDQFDSIKQTRVRHKEHRKEIIENVVHIPFATTIAPGMFKLDLVPLPPRLLQNKDAHIDYLRNTQEHANILREIVEQAKAKQPLDRELDFACKHATRIQELLVYVQDTCPNAITPSTKKVAVTPMNNVKKVRSDVFLPCNADQKPRGNKKNDRISQTPSRNMKNKGSTATDITSSSSLIIIGCLDCSLVSELRMFEHMTGNRSQLMNFISKFLGTVRFGNDHIARIMGYGDYQLENVTISRVYYVEGLGHNLFSVGQFYNGDLEVAFRKNTCFIHNLKGVDLLFGSCDTNLYTVSLNDMLKTSLICLLSKASKTKSWLWHHRISHLNFDTINKLVKDGLARGIPRLKFQKDHLCSACELGKRKKSSHQPKAKDTNQEKIYLLHMDLCGPMRVASINGKKYILVIVDDYSRFTWVRFLRTKDEAPEAIIKCIKNIQV
ncbi:retrovirus-related pol polyprotein from transposon TNT 1-94 [Tanacetum coccineum]